MRIGLISDAPTCTTGFGRTTFHIASALAAAGHDVACFGFKAVGQTFDPADYPFRIWTVGSVWQSVMPLYLEHENFDALFFNMDVFNLKEVLDECLDCGWKGPNIGYMIFDSLPAYTSYTNLFDHIDVFSATTDTGAAYLNSLGYRDVIIGPPGVDTDVFQPLPQKEKLKQGAGLSDHFVIGVFGRNCERKQQAKVLQALHHIKKDHPEQKLMVYFHCTPNRYWNLPELCVSLGVEDEVLFDHSLSDEAAGIPYTSPDNLPPARQETPGMPASYGYIQRMNCCDLVLNVSHSGDFEQVIIEAQACGIPIVHTNDDGIMADAMGNAGILVDAIDIVYGPIGQKLYFVSPEELARIIMELVHQPERRKELSLLGLDNAKKYPWSRIGNMAVETVEQLKTIKKEN
jgi:glycosyltransferase involved in cell wall biosynthesis